MTGHGSKLVGMAVFLFFADDLLAQTAVKADDLARALKPVLIQLMPATLYEKNDNWHHTAMVPVGVKWQGLKPTVLKSPRNHGTWKKLIITAQDLPRTLDVKITDFKAIDQERLTFKVFFTFQMGVLYDQQNWENGVRLWSGSVRARLQIKLDMDCENTLRVQLGKDSLPEFVLRVRATKANIGYDKLVVEHIAGVGGSAAKLIGQAAHDSLRQWRPGIERDLLAKANAAVVKSADTREIRLSFGSLMKTK